MLTPRVGSPDMHSVLNPIKSWLLTLGKEQGIKLCKMYTSSYASLPTCCQQPFIAYWWLQNVTDHVLQNRMQSLALYLPILPVETKVCRWLKFGKVSRDLNFDLKWSPFRTPIWAISAAQPASDTSKYNHLFNALETKPRSQILMRNLTNAEGFCEWFMSPLTLTWQLFSSEWNPWGTLS